MAYIISIETATPVGSVALHSEGKLIAQRINNNQRKHGENITLFIDEVAKEAGITLKAIDAIAVSKGPGSYTGLRIGVSAAKGLCYGLEIPLISVNTLEGITHHQLLNAYKQQDVLFCPMIDARRMEVFCALYNSAGEEKQNTQALVIDEDSFKSHLNQKQVVFFGNGAEKCRSTLTHPNAIFVDDIEASAQTIGEVAFKKYQNKQFEDVAYFEPFYLKEFVALVSKK